MNYSISFVALEKELKKRVVIPYTWRGKKQNNIDDKRSNFIYKTPFFGYVKKRIQDKKCENLSDYILNRWYNFWSAKAVESIFVQHKNITAEKDVKNKYSDFSMYDEDLGISLDFDHKTTVLPKYFENKIINFLQKNDLKNNLESSLENSMKKLSIFDKEVIEWLYKNQSQEQRKHWRNRFFVVLVDSQKKEHWKLKSELVFLHEKISKYLKKFRIQDCVQFVHNEKKVYSCVFWIVK